MNTPMSSDTERALDSTRRYAGQALERAGDRMRDLGSGMRDMAHRGMHTMSDSAHAAQRQLGHYASVTGRYVAEQPLKSALIAAAVGALVAGLILALRRERHPGEY